MVMAPLSSVRFVWEGGEVQLDSTTGPSGMRVLRARRWCCASHVHDEMHERRETEGREPQQVFCSHRERSPEMVETGTREDAYSRRFYQPHGACSRLWRLSGCLNFYSTLAF